MAWVALVTGGSHGVAVAISTRLKEAGFTLGAPYAGNDEAANNFNQETGILVFKCNVGYPDARAADMKQVEFEIGLVETLINNAGIT